MSTVVVIHQPNYLPWPGYFYKIKSCDKFIILDTVDIQTGNANSLTNRTRIKSSQGEQILTVPIRKGNSKFIKDVIIDNTQLWRKKHLNALFLSYKKSQAFEEVYPLLEKLISQPFEYLSDLNTAGIISISNYLKIRTPLYKASELPINETDRNLRLILLTKYLEGDIYLSGAGGRKYNDEDLFKSHGITLKYTDFKLNPYTQLYGQFLGDVSMVDALFNLSERAADLIA